jgi:hypothetical protein
MRDDPVFSRQAMFLSRPAGQAVTCDGTHPHSLPLPARGNVTCLRMSSRTFPPSACGGEGLRVGGGSTGRDPGPMRFNAGRSDELCSRTRRERTPPPPTPALPTASGGREAAGVVSGRVSTVATGAPALPPCGEGSGMGVVGGSHLPVRRARNGRRRTPSFHPPPVPLPARGRGTVGVAAQGSADLGRRGLRASTRGGT